MAAKQHNATRLFDACFDYACKNFEEIATTDRSFGVGVGAELWAEIVSEFTSRKERSQDEDEDQSE